MNYNGPGIYALYNVEDGKIYIGKSKNVKSRISQHRVCFKNNSVSIHPMYSEDIGNFHFFTLHKLTDEHYDMFGTFLERLYMWQCYDMGITLYNRDRFGPETSNFQQHILFDLSVMIHCRDNIVNTTKENTGRRPQDINQHVLMKARKKDAS